MELDAFRALLRALDDVAGADEDLQELNAEFEDALMLMEMSEPEELEEDLETLDSLRRDYEKIPAARELAARLGELICRAREEREG